MTWRQSLYGIWVTLVWSKTLFCYRYPSDGDTISRIRHHGKRFPLDQHRLSSMPKCRERFTSQWIQKAFYVVDTQVMHYVPDLVWIFPTRSITFQLTSVFPNGSFQLEKYFQLNDFSNYTFQLLVDYIQIFSHRNFWSVPARILYELRVIEFPSKSFRATGKVFETAG